MYTMPPGVQTTMNENYNLPSPKKGKPKLSLLRNTPFT